MIRNSDVEEVKYLFFWDAFSDKAVQLRELLLNGQISLVCSRVHQLLIREGIQFAYEVTIEPPDTAVLIFSPESNPAIAPAVDEFVKAAPPLPGWVVYPRRQRCDWKVAF